MATRRHGRCKRPTPGSPFLFAPKDFGIGLGGVYLVWIIVIGLLYGPCRWFSAYKKMNRQWWLSYV